MSVAEVYRCVAVWCPCRSCCVFRGFGHIAQRTATVAKTAFNMKVAAVRRDPSKEDGGLCDIPLADKRELFASSDFVVCVLPGTPQTLDYCGPEEFAAMKPDGVFISIGRGVCVDEDALAAALQAGAIKGAALDVFKVEPLPESSPLWDCGERKSCRHLFGIATS